uniref:Uncharacterized protein n=1 Tax=Mandrillus leucophaeus TaxID=9568 RepID=A0A2K6A979_MANLE
MQPHDSRTLSPKPFSFCPALPNVKPAVCPILPRGVSEPLLRATKDRAMFYPPRTGLGTATQPASSPPASSRGRAPSKSISPLLPGPEEAYNHRRPPRPGRRGSSEVPPHCRGLDGSWGCM